MTFTPQNFQNQNTPAISAQWLNGVDVTVNSVLAGAQTVPAALAALGIINFAIPLTIDQGGTNAITASTALANLGGTSLATVVATINQAYIGQAVWPLSAPEIAHSVTPYNYARENTPVYDMSRYGILPNGVDNTAIVQAIYNMLKVTGGTMVFPFGDWAFYLDVTGITKPVFIEGNGSTFRPFTATPTQSCVVFCNNTGQTVTSAGTPLTSGGGGGVPIFSNCTFLASLYTGGSATGDVNCAVAYYGGQSGKFWNCFFTTGKIAAFYGWYAQYTEFWSCGFYSANLNATSAGCLLTGYGNGSGSNEVEFIRCVFQGNAVALWIQGAFHVRSYHCNFQGNGTAAPYGSGAAAQAVVLLDADSSGFGCVMAVIEGGWFEVNYAPHIAEASGAEITSPRILLCNFFGGGPYTCEIVCNYCSDWVIENCAVYGTTMTCNINCGAAHPKLTYHGNNFIPALTYTSGADLDIHCAGTYTATLTGVTATVTTTIKWSLDGMLYSIFIPAITGTSNSTACTITGGPAILSSATGAWSPVVGVENNSAAINNGWGYATAGTINLSVGGNVSGFTASGTKGVANASILVGSLY